MIILANQLQVSYLLKHWEAFLKDYTTPFNEIGITVLRTGFFLGYKSYFNRLCNEILDGINHNESIPFST